MKDSIIIVGLGPGDHRFLSIEAIDILSSGKPLFLRTEIHPTVDFIKASGLEFSSFDDVYESEETFEEVYSEIVKKLIQLVRKHGSIVYAVPGHPLVGETTVRALISLAEADGIEVRIINGMSFLDLLMSAIRYDPGKGLAIMDAHRLDEYKGFSSKLASVIMQVNNRLLASQVKLFLLEELPADYEILIVKALGNQEQESLMPIPLCELDHFDEFDHLTTIFVPPCDSSQQGAVNYDIQDLIEIMATLRSPKGCPWDKEQTHASLKPFLIEEAYEVADAVDSGSLDLICEELGDVLLQIVFHAQIGKENGDFEFNDIVAKICEKMIRRHPHVFSGQMNIGTAEVLKNWDAIKKAEKKQMSKSRLDGIPKIFPALMRAYKIQAKAAKVGFDWENILDAAKKVYEETDEVMAALEEKDHDAVADEIGDLLFAAVNVARFAEVEPETALLKASEKFYRRFRYIEEIAEGKGLLLEDMDLEAMDSLWNDAKRLEE